MKETKKEAMTRYLTGAIDKLEAAYYGEMETIIAEFIDRFGVDADMSDIYDLQASVGKRVRRPDAAFGYILVRQLKYEIHREKFIRSHPEWSKEAEV